ncbi:MAG: 50S ribosomal protein L15 [Phycisphaerae bacterium]|nr:50S ribosomal protein L15 [Phycisphaerae bacterium]
MDIAEITKAAGRDKKRRRVGRGRGSGMGKTSGRGSNGCGSRAGWTARGMAEGGQMPLFRRIPKRGFSNADFRRVYSIVNIADLEERFEVGDHVTRQALVEAGLLRSVRVDVKILGNGELSKKLIVEASRFSKSAMDKITKVGGEAKIV